MYCNYCGKELEENTVFCTGCGAKQDEGNGAPVIAEKPVKSVNIFVIIAAAVLALGTLLPCYSVFGMSISYIQGDGVFVLICAVVAALLAFFKKEKFACIPAAISLCFLLYLSINLSGAGFGSTGIGIYFMWIGTIATGVLPFVKLK